MLVDTYCPPSHQMLRFVGLFSHIANLVALEGDPEKFLWNYGAGRLIGKNFNQPVKF